MLLLALAYTFTLPHKAGFKHAVESQKKTSVASANLKVGELFILLAKPTEYVLPSTEIFSKHWVGYIKLFWKLLEEGVYSVLFTNSENPSHSLVWASFLIDQTKLCKTSLFRSMYGSLMQVPC